ncbi:MAG: MalY/PatB family protein [Erysipelotrichaceae bacterium]
MRQIDYRNVDVKHNKVQEVYQKEALIPMWVAEMDYQTAPIILETLTKRVQNGIFGYSSPSNQLFQAICEWVRKHGVNMNPNDITLDGGVLKSIFNLLHLFTKPQARICFASPAYPQFERVILAANRVPVRHTLQIENQQFTIKFEALRPILETCDVYLLCHPHNPGGKVWSKDELTRLATLCKDTNTLLISDEIHADLHAPQIPMHSMLAITEDVIVVASASKAFNLAGLELSYILANTKQSEQIQNYYKAHKLGTSNALSLLSLESAYTLGERYLTWTIEQIQHNATMLEQALIGTDLSMLKLEAGYLVWLDCSSICLDANDTRTFFIEEAGIAPSFGVEFDANYATWVRLNIAVYPDTMTQAITQLLDAYENRKKGRVE